MNMQGMLGLEEVMSWGHRLHFDLLGIIPRLKDESVFAD
jgi:hypothetical protein